MVVEPGVVSTIAVGGALVVVVVVVVGALVVVAVVVVVIVARPSHLIGAPDRHDEPSVFRLTIYG